MTREYLKDLEPEEVIDRLNNGERVYYEDTRGNKYSYKVYKGMTIRYNADGEVDGYNRSIYSTGEAYFEVVEPGISLKIGKHYRTRNGYIVQITEKNGKWYHGYQYRNNEAIDLSWLSNGKYYADASTDYPEDIVMEF